MKTNDIKKVVVDSCGWVAYFVNEKNATNFAFAIEAKKKDLILIIPDLCLFEVYKIIYKNKSEADAKEALIVMQKQGKIVHSSNSTMVAAAKLSIDINKNINKDKTKISMADCILYETAKAHSAEFWTQDMHFNRSEFSNIKFFKKI